MALYEMSCDAGAMQWCVGKWISHGREATKKVSSNWIVLTIIAFSSHFIRTGVCEALLCVSKDRSLID